MRNEAFPVLLERHGSDTVGLMTTISIKLPEALAQRLEAAARQRQRPKSGLVRDFIERGLLEKPCGSPSFHDLAQTYCGSGRSGLRDLATNPAHLQDYGR